MRIHPAAFDLISQEERFVAAPYQDVAGVWTIGFGHTGTIDGVRVRDHAPISLERAEDLLAATVSDFAEDVCWRLQVRVGDLRFGALVSFAYNLGVGRLAHSTLWRLLHAGEEDTAAWEFRKWRRAGGVIQPGLLTRRGREEQLFRMNYDRAWVEPMPARDRVA